MRAGETGYQTQIHIDAFGRPSGRRVYHEPGRPLPFVIDESSPVRLALAIEKENTKPQPPAPVLNPHLEKQISSLAPSQLVEVIFTVRTEARFPKLVSLKRDEPRDSPENSRRLVERQAQLAPVEAMRAASRQPAVAAVRGLGGEVVEEHGISNAVTARLPAAAIAQLAKVPTILEVSARYEGTPPPNVGLGRTALNSDPWFNAGYDGDESFFYMGVLDTGLRATHQQFTATGGGSLGLHRDCSYGDSSCLNSPPNANYNDQDPYWGHGTGTGNVIMGGVSTWGATFRGVSRVELDYLNVYTHAGMTPGLDATAVTRGFTRAQNFGDDVIVAEVQSTQGPNGAISLAADSAYDMGIPVIGAIGNNSQIGSVLAAPGNAHKALGIGDYDATTSNTGDQNSGFTGDFRIKPDIQGPSNVTSASSQSNGATPGGMASNTAQFPNFNGTSAGTAFMGGALAIMWDWYNQFSSTSPGNLYTALLAQGDQPTGGSSTVGNGRAQLMGLCSSWWSGSVTLNSGSTSTLTLNGVPANRRDLRLSIWWPEGESETHNDIDLELRDPSNNFMGTSTWGGSVWERVRVAGNIPSGNWTIFIRPFNGSLPRSPQVVYYTVVAACQ